MQFLHCIECDRPETTEGPKHISAKNLSSLFSLSPSESSFSLLLFYFTAQRMLSGIDPSSTLNPGLVLPG